MTYKRIACAVAAFLMVGANFAGTGRVFADELTNTGGEGAPAGEVLEGEGTGIAGAEGETNAEGGAVAGGTNGLENNTVTEGEAGTTEGDEVVDGEDGDEGEEGEEGDEGEEEGEENVEGGQIMTLRAMPIAVEEGEEGTRGMSLAAVSDGEDEPVRPARDPFVRGTVFNFLGNAYTVELENPEEVTRCAVMKGFGASEGATCDAETGEVVASETGMYTIIFYSSYTIMGRTIEYPYLAVPVFVFDVEVDGGSFEFSDEDVASMRTSVGTQIEALLNAGETGNENLVFSVPLNNIKSYLNNNPMVTVGFWDEEIPEEAIESVSFEAGEAVMAEISDTETVLMGKSVLVELFIGDNYAGFVYQFDSPVTLVLTTDSSDLEAPEGYTRAFYVIRGHFNANEETSAERFAVELDGNSFSLSNDKFSSFIVVYEDTLIPKAPETGEMTGEAGAVTADASAVVFMGTAMILAFGAIKFVKRG